MNWFIVLIHLNVINLVRLSEVDENFQIPVWPKLKEYFRRNHEESQSLLENDEESGCMCRELAKKWITCFGSEFCKKYPKNIKINVTNLKLRNTNIEEIKRGDFNSSTHLQYLEIEANYNLKRIESGSFIKMENIKNLSISFNSKLTSLEIGSFDGLINLRELVLIKNGFTRLFNVTLSLGPKHLPNLVTLKLNENNFPEIYINDFLPMENSTLRVLGLVLCQIEYIHPMSLAPLKHLTTLRLGENIFNSSVITDLIIKSNELKIPLDNLNLYSIGFKKNPPINLMKAIGNSNITILTLSRNQFELLKDGSFPAMPRLKQLDLREVLAVNVTVNTFNGMPNLKTLLLSKNKFPSVPYGVLLPQLTYLDLSSNSNIFTPSYFRLAKNKFQNMTNLWGLNLSFNNMHVLFNYSFTGLSNLKILGLKQSSIYFIGDGTFLPLRKLIFLDLESNPFPQTESLKKELFLGLEELQVLLLGDCYITNITSDAFVYLKSLKHLGLNGNNIKKLSPELFYSLTHLSRINLDQNALTSWSTRLFKKNAKLEQIILSQNKITNITDAMARDFANLKSLDLSRNPISCNCVLYETIRRDSINKITRDSLKHDSVTRDSLTGDSLTRDSITRDSLTRDSLTHDSLKRDSLTRDSTTRDSSNNLLDLLNEETTYCVYPDEYTNITIVEYYNTVLNNHLCINSFILLIIPITMLALAIITIFILTYKYRWYIRYWLFLTRLALIKRGKMSQKLNKKIQNYDYDAFVSYSNEDRNFVVRLVAMLENYEPYLKLCVYERDFQIGTIITENVLESVGKSRKTLLVISNSYVKSQWCQWEAQVAENHRLFFENEYGDLVNDSIVMIKLGNVTSSNMTPMLKYLMKTRIYLQWDSNKDKQKMFWDKLRKTLAPPKKVLITNDSQI